MGLSTTHVVSAAGIRHMYVCNQSGNMMLHKYTPVVTRVQASRGAIKGRGITGAGDTWAGPAFLRRSGASGTRAGLCCSGSNEDTRKAIGGPI